MAPSRPITAESVASSKTDTARPNARPTAAAVRYGKMETGWCNRLRRMAEAWTGPAKKQDAAPGQWPKAEPISQVCNEAQRVRLNHQDKCGQFGRSGNRSVYREAFVLHVFVRVAVVSKGPAQALFLGTASGGNASYPGLTPAKRLTPHPTSHISHPMSSIPHPRRRRKFFSGVPKASKKTLGGRKR